jgi:hypothetical protein
MADRYWVTDGDSDFHSTDNWSATSGGASGASVPTTGDTAYFDANSGIMHIEVYAPVLCHINTTGIPAKLSILIGNDGSLSLQEHLVGFYSLHVAGGLLTTNNFNITVTDAIQFRDAAVVDLGTSVISIGATVVQESRLYIDDTTTLNAADSTINFYMANQAEGHNDPFFNCYDQDLGAVNIYVYAAPSDPDVLSIEGSFTCETFSIIGDGEVNWYTENEAPTITINTESGLTLEGTTPESLLLIANPEYDAFTFSMASGTCDAINCAMACIKASGGATFNALLEDGNINYVGNTGWSFGDETSNNETLDFEEVVVGLINMASSASESLALWETSAVKWEISGGNVFCDEEVTDIIDSLDSEENFSLIPNSIDEGVDFQDDNTPDWGFNHFLADALAVSEGIGLGFSKTITETLFIYDVLIHGWKVTSDESLVLTDSLSEVLGLLISDWLTLLDSQSNNWNGVDVISDTLNLYDISQKGLYYADTLSDAVNLEDVATRALTITILDVLGFTELANAVRSGGISVSDSVSMLDTSNPALSLIIEETLSAIDAESLAVILAGHIADGMAITDEGSLSRRVLTTNTEALTFVDTVSNKGTLYSLVYDTLKMNVIIELGSEVYECYVLNTPNFMPSMYSGFDFNSYCVFENRAFGANATGIYELAGSTDAGATIHTGVIMNETDFGAANQKRFRRGYFGISGTRPVMIMETEGGERKAYMIDTNGKMVASHDLKSKKWTLSVADFDTLDAIKLIPVILTR